MGTTRGGCIEKKWWNPIGHTTSDFYANIVIFDIFTRNER